MKSMLSVLVLLQAIFVVFAQESELFYLTTPSPPGGHG